MKDKHTRTNLIVAAVLHGVLILGLLFFASKEGMLGKTMQTLSVTLVPKPKIEEVQKIKAFEPKIELPRVVQAPVEIPKTPSVSQPVPVPAAPSVAPEATQIASFSFSDGAKDVISTTDPVLLYKSYMERYLTSKWEVPDGEEDIVMVDLSINVKGTIISTKITSHKRGKWESSVKKVFAQVSSFPQPPPKGFPPTFKIQFDSVEQME